MALRRRLDFREMILAASAIAICCGGGVYAQSTAGESHANVQSQPSNNAFPMAQSQAAEDAASQNSASRRQKSDGSSSGNTKQSSGNQKNSANQTPSGGKSQPSPAKDNPFPEAQSAAAAKSSQGGAGAESQDSTPSSSSSSPEGYSSSDADLPLPDVGEGTSGKKEKLDSFTRDQTQDGRVHGDLSVADLYMKNGNYRGAFLRYTDALRYDPENDTALFGVAEAMCKQNMTGEAMAHYKSYAKDHPQGKYAMKAEKMLEHPGKCTHNW